MCHPELDSGSYDLILESRCSQNDMCCYILFRISCFEFLNLLYTIYMEKYITYTQDQISSLPSNQEYSHCIFDDLDMQNLDLSDYVFTDCSFVKTNLRSTKCNGSVFTRCNFSNANIIGCNLFSAEFIECKLLGILLSQASSIIGTEFKKCNFDYADMRALDLSGQDFSYSSFIETDLSLTNLEKTSFINSQFININTNGAKLQMTDLRGATVQGIHLQTTNLKGMIFTPEQILDLVRDIGIVIMESDQKK